MSNIIEINSLDAPELDPILRLTGRQLVNKLHPDEGSFVVESPIAIDAALTAGCEPVALLVEERFIRGNMKGRAAEIVDRVGNAPVYVASRELLAGITGFELTRGAMCVMRRPAERCWHEVIAGARRVAVLENIVDSTNVGAIFRSAAGLGIDAVLLTPECCDPLCRRAVRVSMGTVLMVPFARICEKAENRPRTGDRLGFSPARTGDRLEFSPPRTGDRLEFSPPRTGDRLEFSGFGWPLPAIDELKKSGFKLAAMALRDDSLAVNDPALRSAEKLAIVLGTEGDGLLQETIDNCDYTVCIPMAGRVDSLNVGAAAAIAFFEMV